jgi:hypothetical protein
LRLDKEVSGLVFRAFALVRLLLAEILTVAGFGFPHDHVGGPDTLQRQEHFRRRPVSAATVRSSP